MTLWMGLLAAGAAGQEPQVTQFHAQSASTPAPQAAQTTKLQMSADPHDRMTVQVTLGDSRPYQFLVDTGADRTSVSRELAQELALSERPHAILHSATGQSDVRVAWLPEISVSKRTMRNIRAPMLAAEDIGADGILGIDSLRSQRVVFDFGRGQLSILSSDAPDELADDAIVVRARRKEGRLIVTDAEADGERVSVVLDTGSALTVGNPVLRNRLSRRGQLSTVGPIELISVTGGSLRGELAIVKRMEIGGARLEGLQVVFVDAHTFRELGLDRKPAILLGMNALRGFDQVSIDFAERTLSLVLPKDRGATQS